MTQRHQLLVQLAHDLHHEPHQPSYRKRPYGNPVVGWHNKLSSYFWPNPETNYAVTYRLMEPWFSEAGQRSQRLVDKRAWSSEERKRAAELAWCMLKWGGVTRQSQFSEATVEAVFRKALGLNVNAQVPMNSGWTKVAALATAYLEDQPGAKAHVIWDSRVSTSLVSRLEKLLIDAGIRDPKQIFPSIGAVPGRGGTRLTKTFKLKWSHAYGSWNAQEAGSVLVRELRDILNRDFDPMPLPSGSSRTWTVRGVESVLFMDGY